MSGRRVSRSYALRHSGLWYCCPDACDAYSFGFDLDDYVADLGMESFVLPMGSMIGQEDGNNLVRPLSRGYIESVAGNDIVFTHQCIAETFKVGDEVVLIDATVNPYGADGEYDYAAGQFGAVQGNVVSFDAATRTLTLDAAPTAVAGDIVGIAAQPLGVIATDLVYGEDYLFSPCNIAVYCGGDPHRSRLFHFDGEIRTVTNLKPHGPATATGPSLD